jgi:hypothetical protein
MEIDKSKVLQVLRSRGLDVRADWVERELPDRIDTDLNTGILATLGIDPADLADRT